MQFSHLVHRFDLLNDGWPRKQTLDHTCSSAVRNLNVELIQCKRTLPTRSIRVPFPSECVCVTQRQCGVKSAKPLHASRRVRTETPCSAAAAPRSSVHARVSAQQERPRQLVLNNTREDKVKTGSCTQQCAWTALHNDLNLPDVALPQSLLRQRCASASQVQAGVQPAAPLCFTGNKHNVLFPEISLGKALKQSLLKSFPLGQLQANMDGSQQTSCKQQLHPKLYICSWLLQFQQKWPIV